MLHLSYAEVLSLSVALSANNMGIGLSASIAGLPLLPAATVTFLFSLLFLSLGNRFECCKRLHLSEKQADLISGFLLVGLGFWEAVCGFH